MSVRSEIHEAFDELAPRNVGLEERVLATVAVDRGAKLRWAPRLRAPLSLVAVVLVIAVVAGALMGGRLLADWKKFTAPPAPAVPQTPLQKLEARPLRMHQQAGSAHCDAGPYDKDGALGAGPLHTSGSAVSPVTRWGVYFNDSLYADRPVKGPLLVRARDLVTFQPVVFVGQFAAGPVVGTDVVNGQPVAQRMELVIDDVAPPYAWLYEAGVQNGDHCEGWQIDGPDFTENFNA